MRLTLTNLIYFPLSSTCLVKKIKKWARLRTLEARYQCFQIEATSLTKGQKKLNKWLDLSICMNMNSFQKFFFLVKFLELFIQSTLQYFNNKKMRTHTQNTALVLVVEALVLIAIVAGTVQRGLSWLGEAPLCLVLHIPSCLFWHGMHHQHQVLLFNKRGRLSNTNL